jgi:cobalamin biosynthesis protein CbiD
MMFARRFFTVFATAVVLAGLVGCEQKTTRKVTVDTPTKKVEIKVEKTKKR